MLYRSPGFATISRRVRRFASHNLRAYQSKAARAIQMRAFDFPSIQPDHRPLFSKYSRCFEGTHKICWNALENRAQRV